MGMTNELKRIMRDEVRNSLADEDGEVSEAVLPDYAKDWPRTFDNYSVDTKGLSWWCDAGEVLIGGKGAFDTTLTWEQLRPFLRINFVIPTR